MTEILTLGLIVIGLTAICFAADAAGDEVWLHPKCERLHTGALGPFVELSDGALLTIKDNKAIISRDDGKTWPESHTMYDGPPPGAPSNKNSCVMLKTRRGTIVVLYMDLSTLKWSWDSAKGEPTEARLDVWAIRSLDEGKTWIDRQCVMSGYCGALIDIIETRSGRIAAPIQILLRNPARHAIQPRVSDDDGQTWRPGNIIDLGGHGHHDGAMEPTLIESTSGRLCMLIRTNFDRFWEAYSEDEGRWWRVLKPSRIDASSAPGFMTRLASGRLALVWNRLYPEGKTEYRRMGGEHCIREASWHREELSIAFSEDDGETWSAPVVFARTPKGLSYPYVFERRPGELWITTRFNTKIGVRLFERDFAG